MEANTTMRTAGTTVNVTCGETLMFPDRQPYKTAACDDEGSWRPEVPDCIGKCERHENGQYTLPVETWWRLLELRIRVTEPQADTLIGSFHIQQYCFGGAYRTYL